MSDDPMAEFLARERAALGAEADLFQNDSSGPASEAALSPGQQGERSSGGSFAEPMMVDSEPVGALSPEAAQPSTADSQFQEEWQAKQRTIIEDRDRQSEEKHGAIVEEAKQAIDKFYEEYNEKKEKSIQQNRANQEMELQAANKGSLWERALKQIDMATKASADIQGHSDASHKVVRDTSRMRELLQDLKRDKEAPGVKSKDAVKASA
ncbi:Clathrin light chain [Coemansia sp. RSA 1813]|nr:Clathrin light chain [Coemansia sp. RSA 1646]KAJ1767951.1 Clathrin light chain [Coemansia sp. RSA 1843]KAJ2086338.1 Clathrin light chain [Coemansia sp. RSA 986]KAJ2210989.1 Clathrin light chain [Coemansia sp. RSA 487]KAJ2564142.1 Clathrin light chain [Coemansia sp. RSA 1813]